MLPLKRSAGALALFAGSAIGLWFWLEHISGAGGWLQVEGPPYAVMGEAMKLRVQVASAATATMLCADLHWSSERNSSQGFLAAGEARAISQTGGTFDFTIPVPALDKLRFVHAILYLSPDGNWSNHTFAASTGLIPVSQSSDGQTSGWVTWPLSQLEEGRSRFHPVSTPLLRWATGFAWLIGAVWLGRQIRQNRGPSANAWATHRWSLLLVVGFALAGIWELAGWESSLGNWARSWARAEDVYYPRAVFQKAVISVTVAALVVSLARGWRHRTRRWLPLSFGFYLALAAVNLLSLHAIDVYAAVSWHGLGLVDALKFLCAATALAGLYRGRTDDVVLAANRANPSPD